MYSCPDPFVSITSSPHITARYTSTDLVILEVSTGGSGPRVEPVGRDKNCRGSSPTDPRHDLHVMGREERGGSGQEVFKISQVRSGRVVRMWNLTGWVGSSQEVVKSRWSGGVRSGDMKRREGVSS